jgi:hypothetical protein
MMPDDDSRMSQRRNTLIKIATSAAKDVFLLPNGSVECGRVHYSGKHIREFKDIFQLIDDHLRRYRVKQRDVSGPCILTVEDLADYMTERWQRSITVERLTRLAAEARIRRLVTKQIFPVFMDYLNKQWRVRFRTMSEEERRLHPSSDTLY